MAADKINAPAGRDCKTAPRFPAPAGSLAALTQHRTIGQRLTALWHEMSPAFMYSYDLGATERWDGRGVGPGRHIGFEGFGISLSLFFGRMPAIGAGAA